MVLRTYYILKFWKIKALFLLILQYRIYHLFHFLSSRYGCRTSIWNLRRLLKCKYNTSCKSLSWLIFKLDIKRRTCHQYSPIFFRKSSNILVLCNDRVFFWMISKFNSTFAPFIFSCDAVIASSRRFCYWCDCRWDSNLFVVWWIDCKWLFSTKNDLLLCRYEFVCVIRVLLELFRRIRDQSKSLNFFDVHMFIVSSGSSCNFFYIFQFMSHHLRLIVITITTCIDLWFRSLLMLIVGNGMSMFSHKYYNCMCNCFWESLVVNAMSCANGGVLSSLMYFSSICWSKTCIRSLNASIINNLYLIIYARR